MNELVKNIENVTPEKNKEWKLDETLDEGLNEEETENKEYETLDKALENASEEEKAIYKKAGLEKSEVNGRECLTRDDIDYEVKDDFGRTNLERMQQGLAPLEEGKPIELHHIGQKQDSPLAELTREEHRGPGNDGILHDKTVESEIDRNEFNKEKENHWKERAEQVLKEREEA